MANCPEVNETLITIKYRQYLASQWYTSLYEDPVSNVEDYDIDPCVEYENIPYQLSSYSTIQNYDNKNCTDQVLQSIGSNFDDRFIFISTFAGYYCAYGYSDTVRLGKSLNSYRHNRQVHGL